MVNKLRHIVKHPLFFLVATVLLVILAETLYVSNFLSIEKEYTVEKMEQLLHQRATEAEQVMDEIRRDEFLRNCSFNCFHEYYTNRIEPHELAFFVYRDDCLVYWSDHNITLDYRITEDSFEESILYHSNAWFKIDREKIGEMDFILMIPIKYEYAYENDYLKNHFHSYFSFPSEIKIYIPKGDDNHTVRSRSGDKLFAISYVNAKRELEKKNDILFILYVFAGIFFVLGLRRVLHWSLPSSPWIRFGALVLILALVRFIMLFFDIPEFRTDLMIFDPSLYASSTIFPSLADFLINMALLCYLGLYLWKNTFYNRLAALTQPKRKVICTAFTLVLLLFYAQFISVNFRGIIENSNINFNINNLFEISIYSVYGILVIILMLFSFFILADFVALYLVRINIKFNRVLAVYLGLFILHLLFFHFVLKEYDLVQQFWSLMVFLVILFVRVRYKVRYRFASALFIICVFAIYSSHSIVRFSEKKEKSTRIMLAQKLAINEDPFAEILFIDVKREIEQSEDLKELLVGQAQTQEKVELSLLIRSFFGDYWQKFEIYSLIVNSEGAVKHKQLPSSYIDRELPHKIILDEGVESSIVEGLYLISKSTDGLNYVAKIQLEDHSLYLLFYSRLIPEELGFPDLLKVKQKGEIEGLARYSYARYVDDKLTERFGTFNYRQLDYQYDDFEEIYQFKSIEGYSHLVYKADQGLTMVLSRPETTFIDKLTVFSYLVIFYSLFLLLCFIGARFYYGNFDLRLNLKSKIHIALIATMVLSLMVFGVANYFYIMKQYEEKNNNIISEKIHSVLIELMQKIGDEKELDEEITPYIHALLKKFSNVFFTDINLYDVNGQLIASSRDMVFKEGLVSEMMNSEAYIKMAIEGKSEFIHQEKIGELNYLSAYLPFNNKENEILAYLNLPYFAKQGQLQYEISGLLITLINLFVLLFALSIMSAIFASNTITKPLRILQESLGKMELGKNNEPIAYSGNDEISALVDEYNRKVAELKASAEKLAKSERESAWREMAKQVAHEIKNPLTPMKLSIQHLEHSYENKAEDWDQRFKKVTKTLIEQIDTLSNIASEFSNFAQMPKAKLEKVDLEERVHAGIHLFEEDFEIQFIKQFKESAYVLADKNLLLQAFNNILKNAVQAVREVDNPEISVSLKLKEKFYILEFKDNGIGIREEDKKNIFVPNFTTKSTGMGLGLAMTKNIIENVGGEISFTSKENKGSTFVLKIPAYTESV
jgi:two-component system, NtrC family, nitrogen regulation sensor histidine kinase NtrY